MPSNSSMVSPSGARRLAATSTAVLCEAARRLPEIARIFIDDLCRGFRALIQPLDRRDLVAGGLAAGEHVLRTLDGGHHVMRIGVNDGVGIAGDRDMSFPEDQIA